ncbi:MAG: zinc ribbon domain-containing protein [Clostridia bacterium]|nr:zinc ribbon domain-containing protein [Clostridia bacterium]
MECLRCGAKLKDKAVVCNKCGFIVKGAKKVEATEPQLTFEERVNQASVEELRAWILAYKRAQEAPKKDEKVAPEKKAAISGKHWAAMTFVFGLLSCLLIVIPGFNVVTALALFVLAFIGFGKSAGQKGNLALIGVILSVVGICGSWIYNAYFAHDIGVMLGFIKEVAEEG